MTTLVSAEVAKSASDAGIAQSDLQRAAGTSLGIAATKSHALQILEENEARLLVNKLVELQLKKMELKLRYFDQIEAHVENEKVQLDRERVALSEDRLAFRRIVEKSGVEFVGRGGERIVSRMSGESVEGEYKELKMDHTRTMHVV